MGRPPVTSAETLGHHDAQNSQPSHRHPSRATYILQHLERQQEVMISGPWSCTVLFCERIQGLLLPVSCSTLELPASLSSNSTIHRCIQGLHWR